MRIPALLLLCAACTAPQNAPPPAPAPPWFVDVAREAGLAGQPAGRVNLADVDGDGRLDCLLERQRLYLQRDGAWEDATERSGLNARRPADVVVFGDVDNDGDLDCFSGKYLNFEQIDGKTGNPVAKDEGFRSEILLNDGRGVFTPVPDSGVAEPPSTVTAACFLDFDADGRLDLFVGSWYRNYGNDLDCYPARLYRGRGDGTFEDVTERMGLTGRREPGHRDSFRPVYGVTHGDWNNDGRQDLFVCAYGRQWNQLWENRGDRFVEVGERTGFDGDDDRSGVYPPGVGRQTEKPFRSNGNTFDCALGDVDNDGDLDCFLGEITHWWAGPSSDLSSILWNEGPEKGWSFRRDAVSIVRTHEGERWNQGDIHATWFDFDNDGRLDLLLASSDYPDRQELRLFRQKDGGSFEDVTAQAGFDWEGAAQVSVADVDGDGDLDILVGRSFMRLPGERTKGRIPEAGLFRNEVGSRRRWITLTLAGTKANRGAVGARVTVRTGAVTQMREVRAGEGCGGHQNPAEVHFGLGDAGEVEELTVRWPDREGTTQSFRGVPAGRRYALKQGEPMKERP